MTEQEIIFLLQKFIRIPSYVKGKDYNEIKLAKEIELELKQIQGIQIKRQYIDDIRYNIIVTTPGEPQSLLAAHMDTVPLSENWTKDPWGSDIEGDKFYGLGSADTKSSVVSIILTLKELARKNQLKNVMGLFYCDEEYEFLGMEKFTNQIKNTDSLKMAICGEPSGLTIGNSQRGVLDIELQVTGRTGHSAKRNGISASEGIISIISDLREKVLQSKHKILGKPSFNIASLNAGILTKEGKLFYKANIIPDFASSLIEIRMSAPEHTAEFITNIINKASEKTDVKIKSFKVIQERPVMIIGKEKLQKLITSIEKIKEIVDFVDPSVHGYSDVEFIFRKLSVPCCYFGPKGGNMHGPDEWVSISSIAKVINIYLNLLI